MPQLELALRMPTRRAPLEAGQGWGWGREGGLTFSNSRVRVSRYRTVYLNIMRISELEKLFEITI